MMREIKRLDGSPGQPLFSYRARAGASHFRLSFLVKFEFTLFNKWVRLPCMLVLYGTCRV